MDEVDLGYRFLPQYWGRGLATEASVVCLAYGFDVLGLERIIGITMPENLASMRVLEKVGMERQEPILCEGEPAELFTIDVKRYRSFS
jgi:RimJ/RimL family protein N-acetyltransferase